MNLPVITSLTKLPWLALIIFAGLSDSTLGAPNALGAPPFWCATEMRKPIDGGSGGGVPCGGFGPADIPANRDACIPVDSTPVKVIRLKFNVFREDDGSNPATTQAEIDAKVQLLNENYLHTTSNTFTKRSSSTPRNTER